MTTQIVWIICILVWNVQSEKIFGQKLCLQNANCNLPDCFCATNEHFLPVTEIPQIVYFAIDDEIDASVGGFYERLFHPSRKNPNGCPISMTMFATNKSTDYSVMEKLFEMGMEIGAHNTIQMTEKKLIFNETLRQKEYISRKTKIPIDRIIGFRSPYLATAGDDQIDVLRQNGFKYDISYTYTRRPETGLNIWPFTLDFGWKYPCNINPCPKHSHKGFWEVPVNSMWDFTKSDICAYADSCTHSPPSANEMFRYLWNNFNNSYSKNKAPFGLHLHGRWLNDPLRLWAVDKFIKELNKLSDVYIVSIDRMLNWMENPVKLSELNTFLPWNCSPNLQLVPPLPPLPERCEQGINCNLPGCFCDHLRYPLEKENIPQMVYFALDGSVDGTVTRYFDTLFNPSRKNPNGCPIRYNLFLSHTNTDYSFVQQLFERGAEIGTNGLGTNYLATKQSVFYEASKMKENIVVNTNIPKSEIKGFRSPYLSTAGDDQIEALQEAGYKYDISYTFTRRPHNSLDAWPITLDYGWPYVCNIAPCPEKSHKGFWEIPVNSLYDYTQSDFCTYADECRNQPQTEDETFQYLMDNFMNGYNGNKVPFGVHLHTRWFHTHQYLRGVNKFINALLKMKDVYIVSVSDIVSWIKNPISLKSGTGFIGWKCPKTSIVIPQQQLPPPASECSNGVNCLLPDCFCATNKHPMQTSDIPQMVYFAFDDDVNLKYSGYYFSLFGETLTNPNGCPMTFTLFTINKGTDYSFVEYFYRNGHEIASHGANNIPTKSKNLVLTEAGAQKQNIMDNTNVTAGEIIGFRSPQLSTAGDDQIEVLRKLGYKYDASYTYTRRPETGHNSWPFTADYGWTHPCNIGPCPYFSHKGFWLIPINSMWDYTKTDICTFTDECREQPPTEKDVFDYLWSNFQNSYKGNRAPFGIHLQPLWLNDMKNLVGVKRFIEKLASLEDVYVISISKVIEWMKKPTSVKNVKSFGPWMCSSSLNSFSKGTSTKPEKIENSSIPKMNANSKPEKREHFQSVQISNIVTPLTSGKNMGVPIHMPVSQHASYVPSDTRSINIENVLNSVLNSKTSDQHTSPSPVETTSDISTKTDSHLNMGECVQGVSCKLPFCFCEGKTIPLSMPKLATPQMVFLSFDGTLNHADHGHYLNLLGNRKNPNNCSISATFFVNQEGSNITAIKDMYDRGYEIAMRGYYVLRPSNASKLESEIVKQKEELHRYGITDILGWKTVGYTSLTSEFKKVLKKLGFRYDSTNYYDNNNNLWPFTLDYGPTNHSLLWEIPNLALTDYSNVFQCQYADGCFNRPKTVNSTFTFLWNNFKKHYMNGNKPPFGISLRKTWLSHAFYNDNLEGLKLFLDVILNLRDVYIVSTKQVMEWMESPTSLDDISRQKIWACK